MSEKKSKKTTKTSKTVKQSASKGLGDDIEKYITKPLGIKKVVDTVADALDADCGCEKRKEKLNQWFPKRGSLTQSEQASRRL